MKKKILLNASALKRTSCDQQYAFTCVDGLVSSNYVEVLNFGKAVHCFAELMQKALMVLGSDFMLEYNNCFAPAMKGYMEAFGQEAGKLAAACMSYQDQLSQIPVPFRDPATGKLLLEQWFEVPSGHEFPDHEIFYCGTIDLIGFDGETISIIDYKTSRIFDQEKVLSNYQISTQMIFYYTMVYRYPEMFSTDLAFITAAKLKKIQLHIVPCFLSVKKGSPPNWRVSAPIEYTEKQIAEYEELLASYLEPIKDIHEVGHGMKNGWISDLCSKCDFSPLCHTVEPDIRATILRESFVQRPYNPKHYT